MKRSAVIFLILNTFCAFSQIPREFVYYVGGFFNATTEVGFEFDAEEIFYVDFQRHEVVVTLPKFIVFDPSQMVESYHVYRNALKNKKECSGVLGYIESLEKEVIPPEEKDPPESVLYPSEEVELGVENSLVCFVNRFYPPSISVIWTKNGQVVSEGVSLGRYYPNSDQTFHQFSTLTFTPKQGDVYSCTVEHSALERPKTRIWDVDLSHSSLGLDIFCGVGLTVALMGVATGTFLIVKGHYAQ